MNRAHDLHVTRVLLESLEEKFHPTTWSAFSMLMLHGKSAPEVARELDISVNAVYIAKSRVLTRLREEAEGLID